jgi:TolB-like protein
MTSLIQSFEYDIFISYRQKDNKGDRWVSRFVDDLKEELESTFKEDVSVYFDINPHNGLLETHEVAESLREKLRCVIFIPIFSRTYCDPNSFAWEHEFKAFIDQASRDSLGLKVKLLNGNVASRVLPVRIHDLDEEDNRLCESVLGTFVRGIDFIYKEPGVNRPLSPDDDEAGNLNKTRYRNQLNKVALAIREIIAAARKNNRQSGNYQQENRITRPEPKKNRKTVMAIASFIVLALFIAGYFILRNPFTKSEVMEKSIAVLPFFNVSGDPGQEYMSDGLTEDLINHLYKVASFDKVIPLASVLKYKGWTDLNLAQVAGELNVNYIITGTYKRVGEQVVETISLIQPQDTKPIWLRTYNEPYTELLTISPDVTVHIANNLKAFLTNSESRIIQKIPRNEKAFEMLQKAKYMWQNHPKEYKLTDLMRVLINQVRDTAKKAISIDSTYADAWAWVGTFILWNGTYTGSTEMSKAAWKALPYIDKALEIDPDNPQAHYGMASFYHYSRWDYVQAEKEYLKAIELEPSNSYYYFVISEFYLKMNRPELAISYYKKGWTTDFIKNQYAIFASYLGDKKGTRDSVNSFIRQNGMQVYKFAAEGWIRLGDYGLARQYLDSAIISGDDLSFPRFQADLALVYYKKNETRKAEEIVNNLKNEYNNSLAGSPDFYLGWYYSGIGGVDSAYCWLDKAFKNTSAELPWLKIDPVFNSIRNDPRYADLYEKTAFKAYDDYLAIKKNN